MRNILFSSVIPLALTASHAVAESCSSADMQARDYSGQTLRILSHEPPVMGGPMAARGARFAELTGAEFEITHVGFGDLYQEVMFPFMFEEDSYDVVVYGSLWIGDFEPFLARVPERIKQTEEFSSVTSTYRQIATWADETVQFPIDGDRHYLKYRRDALENPEHQAKFEAEYGRPLAVPTTWKEYAEVARFFTGWDWDGDGEVEYGAAEFANGLMMFSSFMSRSAPYVNHPDVGGGVFFDLETMTPLINSSGFVRALEDMVAAREYWPPNGDQFSVGEEVNSFGGGEVAMSFTYDDSTARAMEPDSPIRGLLGFALPPGATEAWNNETGAWDELNSVNHVPYIAWGWTAGVPASSPNTDMAFDYLCFFISDENHVADLSVGHSGVNPFREGDFLASHYVDNAGWPEDVAQSYANALAAVDASPRKMFDLRTPGVNQFIEALVTGLSSAVHDGADPQEALDQVASDWTNILNEVGIDTVRQAYAPIVAIEDGATN